MYQVESPVLFLIFNRPDTTLQVFEKIREQKPKRLYISADGPRADRPNEEALCRATRELIKIDWECEVKTLYHKQNLGCKMAVSGGIKWFFQHEEQGIILEDDCLPNVDFFKFCDTLLNKYKEDTRVVHIGGSKMNYNKTFGNATYYFSKYTNVWGWASWRRVWEKYDENLAALEAFIEQDSFSNIYEDKHFRKSLLRSFVKTKQGIINTWDYQYCFLNFCNNGLCISPNYNMITNIGFTSEGTHTNDTDHPFANLPLESITIISHPTFVLPIIEADYHLFKLEKPSLIRRIKAKINTYLRVF
jgi:hypothetical protein